MWFHIVSLLFFYQSYCLEKTSVVRSFNESLEELADLSNIPPEMLEYRDDVTMDQLLGCAQNVIGKKSYHLLAKMFCCELKYVVDIPKKFISEKFKERFELTLETKNKFTEENPLNFEENCSICGFKLGIRTFYDSKTDKMTYGDFIVRQEYHFLENIFSYEELKRSNTISNLETFYHKNSENFLTITANLCLTYCKTNPINMLCDEKIKEFIAPYDDSENLFKQYQR